MVYSLSPVGECPQRLWLSDTARSMGIHIQAGKGSGKSRLMGRMIAWFDFLRGIPLVIFDPHGPTIDNFLDKIVRLPRSWQERLWKRVLYVDVSGRSGFVYPFPLYYRLGGESLYVISQRFLDVVRKLDPHLQTASIEGWNPLWRTGTYTGMLTAASGFQITDAELLLRYPLAGERYFDQALKDYPEVEPAIGFFRELGSEEMKENTRHRLTSSFLNKIALFSLEPSIKAMFGANFPGVDWREVIEKRLVVLLDFRHEHDIERRRFKMMWAFYYLLDFIKHRGAGRHIPISLIIDELAALFSVHPLSADLFASDLDEFMNQIARNYAIWLCVSHQELFQFSERLQKTLMSMGTQILGVTSDPAAALTLARQFFRYRPYWVKKYEPIWMSEMFTGPYVVDRLSVEFTPEEQFLLQSEKFLTQGLFHFLVRPAPGEGNITGELRPVSIANYDRSQYPIEDLVAMTREMLMKQRGWPVPKLLAEIDSRQRLLGSGGMPLRLTSPKDNDDTDFWVG